MCGICGYVGMNNRMFLEQMTDLLSHRGPDHRGFYTKDGIGLGHRRLSIIDLNTGNQPIYNEDRSIVVVFNGEIYNYKQLRAQLLEEGHKFYTQSDTEILVHIYEEFGTDCVKYLNGCFAFAIWDERAKRLMLARDRLGIRPLYYTIFSNKLIFASEVKSILACPDVKKELDYSALDSYLTLRYVPGRLTMFKGIERLPPATTLIYEKGKIEKNRFWDFEMEEQDRRAERDIIDEFYSLYSDSVKLRLQSDVPVGAFLSGGIDSSSIVAMMSRLSGKVNTYCIGFGTEIDEFDKAKKISEFLGTEHHQIILSKNAYELISKISWHLDEPIGDAIIIPIYLLAREVSKSVKVVITGEGADELFGGYIHQIAMNTTRYYSKLIPRTFNRLISSSVKMLPKQFLNCLFDYPASLGNRGRQRLSEFIRNIDDPVKTYFSFATLFSYEEKKRLYTAESQDIIFNKPSAFERFSSYLNYNKNSLLNNVINLDLRYWLPDYTLFKQDRLMMANGLEGRLPFLDHRLVEFCAKIPVRMKLNGMTSKYLLRKSMKNILPKATVAEKKKPFYFPTEKCFDGNFEGYVKDLFSDSLLCKKKLIRYEFVENMVKDRSNELLENKQLMALVILENLMRSYFN